MSYCTQLADEVPRIIDDLTILDLFNATASGAKSGPYGKRQWTAKCPAHADSNPSLAIWEEPDGNIGVKCYRDCTRKEILEALDLNGNDLRQPEAIYSYVDADGNLLYQSVRFSDKKFAARRPDDSTPTGWIWNKGANDVPYRLPDIVKAPPDEIIYVCEGEKDADRLASLGLVATCSYGGAGGASKWNVLAEYLTGRDVVVLQDNDEAGRKYAGTVALALRGKATSIRLMPPFGDDEGYDVSDWLDAGNTVDSLKLHVAMRTEWTPIASDPKPERTTAGAHKETQTDKGPIPLGNGAYVLNGLEFLRANEVKSKKVIWFWDQRVPIGELTVCCAHGGVGKSLLMISRIGCITTGRPFPDTPDVPAIFGSAIIVTDEDDPETTIVPRLIAAGADLNKVIILRSGDKGLNLKNNPEFLVPFLDMLGDVKLVVFESPAGFLGGGSNNAEEDVRDAMRPQCKLARERRFALVCLNHPNKKSDSIAFDRMAGTAAWRNLPRATMYLKEHGADNRIVIASDKVTNADPQAKKMLAAYIRTKDVELEIDGVNTITKQPVYEFHPETVIDVSLDELMAPAERKPGPKATALEEAKTFLICQLTCQGAKPADELYDLAETQGISGRTLRRALHALSGRSFKEVGKMDGGWFWTLDRESEVVKEVDK